MKNQGFGIIEIVITLGFIAVVALAIGKTLVTVNRVSASSMIRTEAVYLAQENIEKINTIQNDLFACVCTYDFCTTDTCLRASDSQSCALFEGYNSCWTQYPKNQTGNDEFYFDASGNLQPLTAGTAELVSSSPKIERKLIIESAFRDANDNIADTGTLDINTKIITSEVTWEYHGETYSAEAKTILTGWQNL